MIFILFPGFGDTVIGGLDFLSELGQIFYYSKNKNKFADINDESIILIAHSIGIYDAYAYASANNRVDGIISLDGSFLGKHILVIRKKLLDNSDAPPELKKLALSAPVDAKEFPIPTLCFRNVYNLPTMKDKHIDHNTAAFAEALDIKNYTVRFYPNVGHYVHKNKDVLRDLKFLLSNWKSN